jgi:hypothetical protein
MLLLCFLHGFLVNQKVIDERRNRDDNGNGKNNDSAGFKIWKQGFQNLKTLNACGKERGAPGDDIDDGFNFPAHAGSQSRALCQHKVSYKKDAELAVYDQQEKKSGKNVVDYKAQKAGKLHDGVGERVEKFAKVADLVEFAGGYTVQKIGYLGNDENDPKYGYCQSRAVNKPRRAKSRQHIDGKKHRGEDNPEKSQFACKAHV